MVASAASRPRARFRVADIFRRHGEAYAAAHPLSAQRHKVLRAVMRCRTAALGGHADVCGECGHERPSYNSCRDRHCPNCLAGAQEKWIAKQRTRVLDTHYFHVVFTLPDELRTLAKFNPKRVYDAMFVTASRTLLDLGRQFLDATIGLTAVLHTWTREMKFHPHVHFIVTGGGLSRCGTRWKATKPDFLFPVGVMRDLYRGKLLDRLNGDVRRGALDLTGTDWRSVHPRLHRKTWVTHAKKPFGGPEQVIEYLGRYTHRVAIASSRLLDVTDEAVKFRTKGSGTETVTPSTFIHRFLQHVLPKGFCKIRHYGLLAASNLKTLLARARALIGALPPAPPDPEGAWKEAEEICPVCRKGVLVKRLLAPDPALAPPLPRWRDTS